ncbi:MAG: T9SS type A sorting domain-containing protein, partial [Bacteroidales bacterium]|nr:T9SS type A sorting domain-containing protein [Bacteroidales bacterium]
RATGLFLDGMGRTGNGDACGQWANTTHVNSQWSLVSIKSTGESISDDNKDLQIYPNPAEGGKFTIDLTGIEMENHVNVEVYSFNGIKIFEETYQGRDKIDLNLSLNKGIYLVMVKNNGWSMSKKLTVL